MDRAKDTFIEMVCQSLLNTYDDMTEEEARLLLLEADKHDQARDPQSPG